MRLIEELDRRDNKPRLHIIGSSNRRIVGCKWADLVLDYEVRIMLVEDFESFFERQAWFRDNKLPFRRGYLLHGPPGCGKTSAIRAMMTSRGLTAYTTRLFDSQVDDSDLDRLFELTVKNRPSMVLLEDLDRAFPKTSETKSRISLQQLLNNLDGVGTGEGNELNDLGIQFLSQREAIDTDGPLGRAIVVIVSAVAELERSLIVERVRAGMRRAKLDGRRIGRAPLDVDRIAIVSDRKTGLSLTLVAKKHGVSRTTVCRLVNEDSALQRSVCLDQSAA
jgi:hypothetical protein